MSLIIFPKAEQSQEEFCSSRSTAALHSPACPHSFVESDAGRIENVHIQHNPDYHTYSRWTVSEVAYIVAYWDRDNDPVQVYADIYFDQGGESSQVIRTKLITIPVFERVERVFKQDLTNTGREELIFLSEMGNLEAIRVAEFDHGKARLLLDKAGTLVEVGNGKLPEVFVYGKTADETEVFRWSLHRRKFERIAIIPGKPKL